MNSSEQFNTKLEEHEKSLIEIKKDLDYVKTTINIYSQSYNELLKKMDEFNDTQKELKHLIEKLNMKIEQEIKLINRELDKDSLYSDFINRLTKDSEINRLFSILVVKWLTFFIPLIAGIFALVEKFITH